MFISRRDRNALPALIAGAVFLLAAGCQTQSPSEQLQKEAKTLVSYGATAQTALGAWQSAKVTRVYARRTVEAMQQNTATEAQSIQSMKLPVAGKQQLAETAKELQDALGNINAALQNENGAALEAGINQLQASVEKLKASSEDGVGTQ